MARSHLSSAGANCTSLLTTHEMAHSPHKKWIARRLKWHVGVCLVLLLLIRQKPVTETAPSNNESPLLSQPFPRWDDRGIDFTSFVAFVHGALDRTATTVSKPKPRARFPETLYMVNATGVHVSRRLRERTTWKQMLQARVVPQEKLFVAALDRLLKNDRLDSHRWPLVSRAVHSRSGLPFLAWYGDYRDCNFQNWKDQDSIPLLTT